MPEHPLPPTVGIVRWGLIGAGDIARKRAAAAIRDAPGSRLLALSRGRPELAESSAKAFGAERWHARWQDLVADPGIDAVYIATPVDLHAEQTIAAARAGKHVLCEKPMAMDVGECDRMIAACRSSNVKLGIAYYRHFYPVIVRVKGIIASGEIGAPVLARIDAFEWFNPQPDHPRRWLVQKSRSGGGPMFDFGCHRLEVLLNLFGPVRFATGMIANVVFEREVEDTAAALLHFDRGPCAALAVTHAALEPRDTLEVFGTRGSVHIAELNRGDLRILTAGGERPESYGQRPESHGQRFESHPPAVNFHRPLIEDFVESIVAGREPAVTGEIGRTVAELESRIYETTAWEQGERV